MPWQQDTASGADAYLMHVTTTPSVSYVTRVQEELGVDGRILVRESETEPVIRVMVEAATHELCEKYVDDVIEVIVNKGHKEA